MTEVEVDVAGNEVGNPATVGTTAGMTAAAGTTVGTTGATIAGTTATGAMTAIAGTGTATTGTGATEIAGIGIGPKVETEVETKKIVTKAEEMERTGCCWIWG